MKKYKILIIICLLLLFVINMHAQSKIAQSTFQFLKIDMVPRAVGMGSSYTMVNNDATSMFYNPAGLALMDKTIDGFITRTPWIAGLSYIGGGGAINLGDIGVFGVSFIRADYGDDIYGTMVSNDVNIPYYDMGKLIVEAYTVGLSYASAISDKFKIGGQIKLCYQHLGANIEDDGLRHQNEVKVVSYDFGTIYYTGFKSLRFGMTVRNFAPSIIYAREKNELPLTFTLGFAMDVLDLYGEHEDPLTVSFEAVHPRDYSERIHLGAEYIFQKMLALRAGYKFNYDNESFTAGIGFMQPIEDITVKLDYSYSKMEFFGAIHRLSIGLAY